MPGIANWAGALADVNMGYSFLAYGA